MSDDLDQVRERVEALTTWAVPAGFASHDATDLSEVVPMLNKAEVMDALRRREVHRDERTGTEHEARLQAMVRGNGHCGALVGTASICILDAGHRPLTRGTT